MEKVICKAIVTGQGPTKVQSAMGGCGMGAGKGKVRRKKS